MLIESSQPQLKPETKDSEHVVGNMDSKCCAGFIFKSKFNENLNRNLNQAKPLNLKRASCSNIPTNKSPNTPPIILQSQDTSNIDSNSILHRNCEQLIFTNKQVTIETPQKSNVNLVQNFSSNINLRKINNNTVSPLIQPNHKTMYNRFSGSVQNLPQKLNPSFRKKSASEMNLSKPMNTTMVNNVEYVNYCPSVLFSRMRKSISTQNLRQSLNNPNTTASGSSSKNWKQFFKFGGVRKRTKKDVR